MVASATRHIGGGLNRLIVLLTSNATDGIRQLLNVLSTIEPFADIALVLMQRRRTPLSGPEA